MMFPERNDGARLRTFSTLGVLRNETDLVANGELVEAAIRDAVAMEVDFAAVGTCNEAAIPIGEQTHDPAVIGHRVQFDVAASMASMIFEQLACGVEGIADRDIDILMRTVRRGIAPDDNLVPGDFQVDPDAEQIALLAARMLALDNDPAGDDPIKEAFELGGALMYSGRDGVGRVHVTKSDLQWQLHRFLHPTAAAAPP
jgi:hypothetical protein